MTNYPKRRSISGNQSGLVSIFSVLIIMGIITLLTIGFTRVVRQAQYRVLNEQLNTQALYAAETAINDARAVIEANATNLSAADKTDCAPNSDYPNSVLDSTLGIEYTCVLVDTSPRNNEYDNVGDPVVNILNRRDGGNISRVLVEWDSVSASDPVGNNVFSASSPSLPSATAWGNGIGMLRIDLMPTSDLTRDGLVNDGYTFFLMPTTNAAGTTSAVNIPAGVNEQGTTVLTRCVSTGAYRCVQELILDGPALDSYYYRIQSFYRDVSMTIGVTTGGSGNTVELEGGQAEIDATGSASGVFKRVRARIPIETNYEFDQGFANDFALLSGESICKRIISAPGGTDIDGGGPINCPTTIIPPAPPGPPPVGPGGVTCPSGVRFPGDPCPAYTGEAYWGSSIGGNGDPSRHENPTGVSLSIRRTYWQWSHATNASSNMYRTIRDDVAGNRLPLISIKPPSWAAVGNGNYDTQLDYIINQIKRAAGAHPVWVVLNHEPEGGGGNNFPDDPGGAPAWRSMQIRFRQRLNFLGRGNIAFMPVLMTYTWDPASGRNPEDWWISGQSVWDAYLVDHFVHSESAPLIDAEWNSFINWVEAKSAANIASGVDINGMPFGIAEWGNRGNASAAIEMQGFWDWRLTTPSNPLPGAPYRDMLAYAYYDSGLNAPSGTWELYGQPLAKFHEILQSPDVKRVR